MKGRRKMKMRMMRMRMVSMVNGLKTTKMERRI